MEEILTGAFSGKIMAQKQQMAANGSAEERSVLLSLFHAALRKEASACQKQEHTAKELLRVLSPVYRALQAEKR